MKKSILLVILSLALIFSGCEIIMQPAPTNANNVTAVQEPEITHVPLITTETTAIPLETISTVDTTLPTIQTPAPAPTPYNTVEFYSCYAHMVSYNPANSWAEFDYFYLHQGQDAIDYLIEYEGYTQIDAENLVNGFADSEFVEQNNNPVLRTIDLDTVPVRIIVNMDGSLGGDLYGTIESIAHINSLYAADPNNLFTIFYYIECDSYGNVIEVRQHFWP